jgi:hypothetical protein
MSEIFKRKMWKKSRKRKRKRKSRKRKRKRVYVCQGSIVCLQ